MEDLEVEEPNATENPELAKISNVDETEEPEFLNLDLSQLTSRGFDGPQTMKLKGQVHESEVLIMVDSGASHCFISSEKVN